MRVGKTKQIEPTVKMKVGRGFVKVGFFEEDPYTLPKGSCWIPDFLYVGRRVSRPVEGPWVMPTIVLVNAQPRTFIIRHVTVMTVDRTANSSFFISGDPEDDTVPMFELPPNEKHPWDLNLVFMEHQTLSSGLPPWQQSDQSFTRETHFINNTDEQDHQHHLHLH